jgi:hypothetical protein
MFWRCDHSTIQFALFTALMILSVHYILMRHLFGRGPTPWHFSRAKRNCLIPINARQHVHVTVFTSTRGYVDRDEVVLSWVRQPKAFVLREGNKCCLPRNGLLSGAVSKKEHNPHGGMLTSESEMAEETASLNSRVSGLAVSGLKHDRSCKLWTARPPESTKMPSSLQCSSNGISESS